MVDRLSERAGTMNSMVLIRSRRLEVVLGSPVDRLTFRDITALPANRAGEAVDLDFKAALYGTSDKERRDLCGDVAALANTVGGLILIGVEEDEDALAKATPGVPIGDAGRSRMLQTLASGVAPLPAVEITSVPSENDPSHGWFLVEVPRSSRAPHAVVVNEGFRFPVRNATTTRYLSEPELAARYRQRDQTAAERTSRLNEVINESLAPGRTSNGFVLAEADTPLSRTGFSGGSELTR